MFCGYSATVQYDLAVLAVLVLNSIAVITDTYWSKIEIPVYFRPLINIGKLPS
jgi:hypothetical protein